LSKLLHLSLDLIRENINESKRKTDERLKFIFDNVNVDIHNCDNVKYLLGEYIDRGAFGNVYVAKSNKNYAIKISSIVDKIIRHSVKCDDDSVMLMMLNECKNEITQIFEYSKLKHIYPLHIISHHDAFTFTSKEFNNCPMLYLLMDKVSGISMRTYLSKYCDDESQYNIIIQLVLLLLSTNTMGYYHNDINMNNILIHNTKQNECTYDICNKKYIYDTHGISPILVDYSFSKTFLDCPKIPMDFIIFVAMINKYIDRFNFDVHLIITTINELSFYFTEKYYGCINNFWGRIMSGDGLMSHEDYNILLPCDEDDIIKINVMLEQLLTSTQVDTTK
jgi:serine/threonine protein kinase